jgi:hypothetical protein
MMEAPITCLKLLGSIAALIGLPLGDPRVPKHVFGIFRVSRLPGLTWTVSLPAKRRGSNRHHDLRRTSWPLLMRKGVFGDFRCAAFRTARELCKVLTVHGDVFAMPSRTRGEPP